MAPQLAAAWAAQQCIQCSSSSRSSSDSPKPNAYIFTMAALCRSRRMRHELLSSRAARPLLLAGPRTRYTTISFIWLPCFPDLTQPPLSMTDVTPQQSPAASRAVVPHPIAAAAPKARCPRWRVRRMVASQPGQRRNVERSLLLASLKSHRCRFWIVFGCAHHGLAPAGDLERRATSTRLCRDPIAPS